MPHLDRLTVLADHLDSVPPDRFWLGTWFANRMPTDREIDNEELLYEDEEFQRTDCGTVACAIGHACRIPEFNALGFKSNGLSPRYAPPTAKKTGSWNYSDWRAVHEFFGLGDQEAYTLFLDNRYPTGGHTTPAQVAERIRAFVRDNTPAAPAPAGNPA